MTTTKFSKSWGGKLFPDYFGTVRLQDEEKYFVGAIHDILLDGVNMGTAKVVATRSFTFIAIRDSLSFLDIGMSAARFSGFLKNEYNGDVNGGVSNHTEFQHITYLWQKRNYHAHAGYIASFMENKLREYQEATAN